MDSGVISTSRDVVFLETEFPFTQEMTDSSPLLTTGLQLHELDDDLPPVLEQTPLIFSIATPVSVAPAVDSSSSSPLPLSSSRVDSTFHSALAPLGPLDTMRSSSNSSSRALDIEVENETEDTAAVEVIDDDIEDADDDITDLLMGNVVAKSFRLPSYMDI